MNASHAAETAALDGSGASELAYYYPDPYWLAEEGTWIKSLLLFFDGIAIMLPRYMRGREIISDPALAGPLSDQGLLKVLEPEWFVDEELSARLAEGMVDLITGGAFDQTQSAEAFAELSMSRMGYAQLSTSRMGSSDAGVFQMILTELKERGLARDSEDGVSIPLRRDVRVAYLMLLAQEARDAGKRRGLDLHPTTNGRRAEDAIRTFLELDPMPSAQDVVHFDLATASVDLDEVPLDEVLDFRTEYRDEHRAYLLNLRQFLAEISLADRGDRARMLERRQSQLNDQAKSLQRLALDSFKKPSNAAGFAFGLMGAVWSLASGNPIGAGLASLGTLARLIPSRDTGSAYSYIFRAHRQWH